MAGDASSGRSRRRIAVRRTVLVVLVLVSVLLFTAFFREGDRGFLHGVKDTAGSAVAPVQDVAVRAVQPVRDGWGWMTGLVHARSERDRLAAENDRLRALIVADRATLDRADRFRRLAAIKDDGPAGYRVVDGSVIGRNLIDFTRRVIVDVGTADGVMDNSPVVAPTKLAGKPIFPALVGVVITARRNSSVVSLLDDVGTPVGAIVQGASKPLGLLKASASGALTLEKVPREVAVQVGDVVVTGGFGSLRLPSVYPPDIPIGVVSSVGGREPDTFRTVQVDPFVDPESLREMAVLAPASAVAKRRAEAGG